MDEVRDATVHVDLAPDIGSEPMSKLGWGSTEQDTHSLRNDAVDAITDEEIHLRGSY